MDDFVREFRGTVSDEEVWAYIDSVIDANPDMQITGIAVSNSLHERGISGRHRGVPIAMDPGQWPEDMVRMVVQRP